VATIVRKKPGESEDRLIAKFRKKVQMDQILPELRERKYYKSPAEKKKEKLAALKRKKRN